MSNNLALEKLSVDVSIFDAPRMAKHLAKLNGALGTFVFYPHSAARDDIPAQHASISCWVGLDPQSCEDIWQQVRAGGFSECAIDVQVGPVESPYGGWVWNVEENSQLIVETFSVRFNRPVQKPSKPEPPKRFWQR
jgi:hypothetical protein